MTIGIEERNGSFEDRLLNFDQMLKHHHGKGEVHFLLSRQVSEFKKALSSIQSTEAENGFLAVQAHFQELEWFEDAWKAFDDKLYSIACRYFDLCAKSSNLNAMLILAHIFSSKNYGQLDQEKSITLYQQAAFYGDPIALGSLGILYFDGLEVQRDEETALNYFLQASKKQDAESMYYLGEMYRTGCVVKQDMARAKKYFEQAARCGYQRAIVKTQSIQGAQPIHGQMSEPKAEIKAEEPVKFIPINFGLRSSQQDYLQATARQAISRHRSKNLRMQRRNSSNSLFQVALFASVLAIVGWAFYGNHIPTSSMKEMSASIFSNSEEVEETDAKNTELEEKKNKLKNKRKDKNKYKSSIKFKPAKSQSVDIKTKRTI
ncbi:MAG: sel1 repeat family protein [Oligoflexales bacterium]|nr:sel1 repeat family protein [Oligoflexales bacterium]